MRICNLIRLIDHSHTVYEFMTALYIYLDSFDYRNVKSCYNRYLKNVDLETENRLDSLIDLLEDYYYGGFDEWKVAWRRIYEISTLIDKRDFIIPMRTLVKIDAFIHQITVSKDANKICIGPLNSNNEEYYLFLKKPEGFFTQPFKQENIHVGRNTIDYMTDSCNSNFKNIVFINKNYLMGYEPRVIYYKAEDDSMLSLKKQIRVAFAPFLQESWFLAKFDDIKDEFEILPDDSKTIIINNAFTRIIEESDREGANIVVFPELALHPTSEKVLKEYLCNWSFHNLKLCFFGSLWQNMSNTSLLFTASGTLLARQCKKIPYVHYHKEKEKYYREKITVSDKQVMFVDIEGVGRIAYFICADVNAGEIKTLSSVMQVDFIIVSAYTGSTDTMMNSAMNKANESGTATVLCNAYLAASQKEDKKALQAFCVIPQAKNKTLKSSILIEIPSIKTDDYGPDDSEIHYCCIEKA